MDNHFFSAFAKRKNYTLSQKFNITLVRFFLSLTSLVGILTTLEYLCGGQSDPIMRCLKVGSCPPHEVTSLSKDQ